jgi:hypothetical protein
LRGVERPHILEGKVEVGAVGWLGFGSSGHRAQGEGAGTVEKTGMFHQIPSGARRDMRHDAKP